MTQQPEPTGIPDLDTAPAASAEWAARLQDSLGWRDRGRAFTALIATLHALRDYLPTDEAVRLGAGLPALLRGLYYEGWHPRARLPRLESREDFLVRVHEALHRELAVDPELVVRGVFALLCERITEPEFEEVKSATPAVLHGMWPD